MSTFSLSSVSVVGVMGGEVRALFVGGIWVVSTDLSCVGVTAANKGKFLF